uniref:Xrn1 helical domain-containing protein n=1 Tax=Vitis vinifera TaxID=29760 RepID=F6HHB8_VITVI
MTVYKKEFKNIGGYMVDMERIEEKKGSFVKLKRVEKFILLVGTYEEKIFKKRMALRDSKLRWLLSTFYTKEMKKRLKENIRAKSDLWRSGSLGIDRVRLGHPGWKERYYKEKCSCDTSQGIESTRKELVQKYTEGLLWVLQYYFSGVPSWTWFYPYHYGPFASDFKGLSRVKGKFERGSPFKPFDQLMGVLPPSR